MAASQMQKVAEILECVEKLDELLQDPADEVAFFRGISVKLKEKLKAWIQLTSPMSQLNPAATTTSVDRDALSGVKLDVINNSREQLLQDLVDVQTQIQQNIKSTGPMGNPFQSPTGTTVKPPLSQPQTESVPNHIHEALIGMGACGLDEETVTYLKTLLLAMKPQNRSSSYGPIGIFWDMESCDVPSNVGEYVAVNVKEALRKHPEINGAFRLFNGYGDSNCCPRHIRLACYYAGVSLIVIPNGRKEAVYKTILRDMFMFACNHVKSYIVLISGNGDFAQALHILGQLGHTVIHAVPSGVDVSSHGDASKYVCDWPSMAHGKASFHALKI